MDSETGSTLELLTVPDAARILRVKPATIRAWILKRKIPAIHIGGRFVRIRRSDVEGLIESNLVPAAA